ncbi:hypothetical protein ACLKA6_003969 [Drosophila palustris]
MMHKEASWSLPLLRMRSRDLKWDNIYRLGEMVVEIKLYAAQWNLMFDNAIGTTATPYVSTSPISPFTMLQMQQHKSPYLPNSSMSVLTIKTVTFHHAGNYTCAPSNARPASITVHVLRGEKPAAMQHANRSILDGENILSNNNSLGLSSIKGFNGTNSLLVTVPSLLLSVLCLLANLPSASHLQKQTPMIFFVYILSTFNS